MGSVGFEMITANIHYISGEDNWVYNINDDHEKSLWKCWEIALFIYTLTFIH